MANIEHRDATPHPARASEGFYSVISHKLARGTRIKARLPCGCNFLLTVATPAKCMAFRVTVDSAKCAACCPDKAAHSPAPTSQAQRSQSEEPSAEAAVAPPEVQLADAEPRWWTTESNVLFAEVLYLHHQQPGTIDHYLFDSGDLRLRFPNVSQPEWFTAVPFLESSWETPTSAVRQHYRALRRKHVHVQPVADDAAGGRKRARRGDGRRGAWHSLVTDAEGRLLNEI